MPDNISMDAKNFLDQVIKAFTNLLKEFPRNAAEDFVYDASTLEKIGKAGEILAKMAGFVKQDNSSLGGAEKKAVKESYNILSRLMDELPKDPADEFMYDRTIHRQVEDARESIVTLSGITT